MAAQMQEGQASRPVLTRAEVKASHSAGRPVSKGVDAPSVVLLQSASLPS